MGLGRRKGRRLLRSFEFEGWVVGWCVHGERRDWSFVGILLL